MERQTRATVKHYTREQLDALNPPDMNEDFGYSKTQVVVDGERYDKLSVFAEQLDNYGFISFAKGMLVGFMFCLILSLLVNQF